MNRFGIARDGQQGRHGIERDVIDFSGIRPSSELSEFVSVGDGEDANDGAFV